jgi:hypothetical protein
VKNSTYAILVPKVDLDGNDLGGIRLPAIRVPLGTYTGWNFFRRGLPEDDLWGSMAHIYPLRERGRKEKGLATPGCQLRRGTKTTSAMSEGYARR